jgi:hypothetical protein
VETIGALEDRSMYEEPAVGYRNPQKTWTKDYVVNCDLERAEGTCWLDFITSLRITIQSLYLLYILIILCILFRISLK